MYGRRYKYYYHIPMIYFTQHYFAQALILGTLAIAGLPAVVFAQEMSTDNAELEEGTSTAVSESVATSTDAITTSTPDITDNYSREDLPSDTVFGDFVVGPGRFDVEIAPGESRVVELIISNRMGTGKIFSLKTEDATGSESGESAVQLLGDSVGPYTLKDFISVPNDEFYLEHGKRVRIPVTISLPEDAEPGGRYGSILTSITSTAEEVEAAGGARSGAAVISRIGTLFFVTTPGDINRESELVDFTTINDKWLYGSGPVDLLIAHENTGTVHTTPYGRVSISNILGEEVGTVQIEPWFVMPDSIRTREVSWDRELLIGRYTATAEINRGYDDIVDTESYSFWVIPIKLVAVVFAGLFVFFLVVRLFFSRFEFKRKD